jgi:hypothetical protein
MTFSSVPLWITWLPFSTGIWARSIVLISTSVKVTSSGDPGQASQLAQRTARRAGRS